MTTVCSPGSSTTNADTTNTGTTNTSLPKTSLPKIVDIALLRAKLQLGVSSALSTPVVDKDLEERLHSFTSNRYVLLSSSKEYSLKISSLCHMLTAYVHKMESSYEQVKHFEGILSSNLLWLFGYLTWAALTHKPQPEDQIVSLIFGERETIQQFNACLHQLIITASDQFQKRMSEYTDLTRTYEKIHSCQEQYSKTLSDKKKHYDALSQGVKKFEETDRERMPYERGLHILEAQIGELEHYLKKQSVLSDEVRQSIQVHKEVDHQLQEQIHLWNDVISYSAPFEERAYALHQMTLQLAAQRKFAASARYIVSILSSYTEGLRSRFDAALHATENEASFSKAVYDGLRLGVNALLNEGGNSHG